MNRKLVYFLSLFMLGVAFTPFTFAQNTIGYVSYDVTAGSSLAAFDITNFTGTNSFLSPDANPVTSEVNFASLSLTLVFASSPTEVLGSSYFSLNGDGMSEDGKLESILVAPPAGFLGVKSATLSGTFLQTTITLADSSTVNIKPGFSATFSDPAGLSDGEYALIVASPAGSSTTPTPEPESLVMVATGLAAISGLRRRALLAMVKGRFLRMAGRGSMLALAGLFLFATGTQAHAMTSVTQVKLAADTVPSSGVAGYNSATTTGSGFPSGVTAASITVSFGASCTGTALATTVPTNYSSVGPTSERIAFAIPATLKTGTYYVSVSDSSPAFTTNPSYCSVIQVTATSTTLAACVPTSSLAVTVGTNVTAYVPYASWFYTYYTGLASVPLEGSGTAMSYTTPGYVNSCASNSTTGEVVCTEDSTNVDLINGTTVTTIASGANDAASFTGGTCYNCGVAINPTNNTAIIAGGFSGGGYGEGVQVLNLSNNTFNTAFPMQNAVSEDISIDPTHNLVLSPGEDSNYTLLKIGAGNTFTEYGNPIGGGDLDSAAEDCTTQIALSSVEFTNDIYLTDLSQATFTPGTPGTWSAPGSFVSLVGSYAAGTSGITSAPGSGHLAVVTGEFGGSTYSVLQLPSTSGSGIPSLVDYAYVSSMPPDPSGNSFSAGFDPHTITAYTSPNNGKAYAVMADYAEAYYYPSYLAIVDLSCVLAQPRSSANTVNGNAAACTRYVAVPAP